MKRVIVLGASGSVGKKAVSLLKHYPETFELVGVSLHSSYEEHAKSYDCIVYNSKKTKSFEKFLDLTKPDIVLNAMSSFDGLFHSLEILKRNISLALANKESIICGGDVLMQYKDLIIPVDSEHNSLFQLLHYSHNSTFKHVTITASGGPYRQKGFINATLADTLKHPTWNMGKKITVDSATMVNKALEIIEAMILFNFSFDQISAVIEPTSQIHAFIETKNGDKTYLKHPPDMSFPISHALWYPNENNDFKTEISEKTDTEFFTIPKHFKIFDLLHRLSGNAPCYGVVINAANEIAVQEYLVEKITIEQIYDVIEHVTRNITDITVNNFTDIKNYHIEAQHYAKKYIQQFA